MFANVLINSARLAKFHEPHPLYAVRSNTIKNSKIILFILNARLIPIRVIAPPVAGIFEVRYVSQSQVVLGRLMLIFDVLWMTYEGPQQVL